MKLLVDMNLSPTWVAFLATHGVDAIHWSSVGPPTAPDAVVMQHARDNGMILFTHDLDFGVLLALTRATGPSVIQVRTQDTLPTAIGDLVVRVLSDFSDALAAGSIISADETTSRVRVLPLR
jgi:predicted nuclease of predicted toxin-antitoxin system